MPMQPIAYNFDLTNVDPYVGAGRVYPAGSYPMAITNMEVRANRDAASGHNLAIEYTIADGEFKGGKYFENLNLWHTTSTSAQEIAFKHLSSIGHAVGVITGTDLTQLAQKLMIVELDYQDAQPEGMNPNTGEKIRAQPARNRVVQRIPYTPESAQQVQQAHVPANLPPMSQANAGAAASAPPMGSAPAQQVGQAAPTKPNGQAGAPQMGAQPQQQAPNFPQGQQATPAAGGAQAAIPPWQR